jgi:hypothetical protein
MGDEPTYVAEPTYTAEEADAVLEELRERLTRIREARQVMLRAAEPIAGRGAARGRRGADERAAPETLKVEIEWLAERGIILRNPENGLVDLPGEREDRRVFLCWRLGEGVVAFWHETDVGCLGRRPL